jgi:23S rRNA maturation mini-RNase III
MRGLQFQDVFTVARILKKMKLTAQTIKDLTPEKVNKKSKAELEAAQQEMGMKIMFTLIENLGEAEEEFYKFIANLKGTTPERIQTMDFEELGQLVNEFKEMKGLSGFFTQVSKLMK